MKNKKEYLEYKIKQIPELPGVYKMLDRKGNIIYIGKSKCLKKRVATYFINNPKWEKAKKMVPLIYDIEYIITDTQLEAMLLECKLIKEIKPHFNVQMKNDERYVYIKIEDNHKKLPLSIVYNREENSFGPFRSRSRVEDMIEMMKNLYPLENLGGKYKYKYHIFPEQMSEIKFLNNRTILLELFSNPILIIEFIKELEENMLEEAKNERFEMASKYRDLIVSFQHLKSGIINYEQWKEKEIIYTIPVNDYYKNFYISRGMVVHKEITEDFPDKETLQRMQMLGRKEDRLYISEKETIDYWDIIYSEIQNAPTDFIYIMK